VFPDKQHYPHRSFEEECTYLNTHVPALENKYISINNNKYKVYVNSKYIWRTHQNKGDIIEYNKIVYFKISLAQDYIDQIRLIISKYIDTYDDYIFTPYGYSLNAYKGSGYITIHVTPQSGCSYVSIEYMGVDIFNAISKLYEVFHYKVPKIDESKKYNIDLLSINNTVLVKSY